MKITENNGLFYDENNNSWGSKEAAELFSPTLKNCSGCSDCSGCFGCSCCSCCSECSNCFGCYGCSYCSCCTGCSNCFGCSGCSDCSYCFGCSGCSCCSDCSNCFGWKKSPEQITSPKMGSRKSQTTVYFDDSRTEVVCGCFRGTLEEFKDKVLQTHGDSQYVKDYQAWIGRVEKYIKGQ